MKTRSARVRVEQTWAALALAAWIGLGVLAPGALAQDAPGSAPGDVPQATAKSDSTAATPAASPALQFDLAGGPVSILSDSLVLEHRENWAEFSGNVRAVQGKTEVRAGRMRVLYLADGQKTGEKARPDEALDKIEAWDNVRITDKDFSARADHAVYDGATRNLVLMGEPAVMNSGENTVAGGRITVNAEGRVTVEGVKGAPVEATFFPESEKGAKPKAPQAAP